MISVSYYWNDQSPRIGDRDTDVEIMFNHHLITLDLGIQLRDGLQCPNHGFNKKRCDPKLDPEFGLQGFIPPGPELQDPRHVNFIKGGQHGGRLLSLDQTFSNCPTPPAQLYPFFPAVATG